MFTSIWEGIKGVVMGFIEWLSPIIDLIIAPFKAIGNVIGGIIGSVKGWFGETVEIGKTELAGMNENKMRDTAAGPVQTNTPALVTQSTAPTFTATSAVFAPYSAASAAPVPGMEIVSPIAAAPALAATSAASAPSLSVPTTASSSGNSLAMEHLEAARRKGVSASDISYTATSAFENAGAYTAATTPFLESLPVTAATPPVDVPDIDREARLQFADAMPSRREAVITGAERDDRADDTPRQNIFHIANMNFNADELRTLLDIVRQLELAAMEPEAVTV